MFCVFAGLGTTSSILVLFVLLREKVSLFCFLLSLLLNER